jgi:hypothetical protein
MHVIREQPLAWDRIYGWIGELKELIAARQEPEIIAHLQELVPEYNPAAPGRRHPVELAPANKTSGLRSES